MARRPLALAVALVAMALACSSADPPEVRDEEPSLPAPAPPTLKEYDGDWEAVMDDPYPTTFPRYELLDLEEQTVLILPAAEPSTGQGWVSTGYVRRLQAIVATVLKTNAEQRGRVALASAGFAFEGRIPESLTTPLKAFAQAEASDFNRLMSQLLSDNAPLLARTCGHAPQLFARLARLPEPVRWHARFERCGIDRFSLVRGSEDGFYPYLAGMLYVALDEQGGAILLEEIILRDIAGWLPRLGDDWATQRAALADPDRPTAPSPQDWANEEPPAGVQAVTYPSDGRELAAWYSVPTRSRGKHPALVYFHGGFAFDGSDFAVTKPFRDAGFVVMTPTLRGENGNPGAFEMFLGEVDDGAAAIRWIAERPEVDPDRIYAFGHSAGGAISALLSLVEDIPLVHSGSAGGLYFEATFSAWEELAPFDVLDRKETLARVLLGHTDEMVRPHYGWVASDPGELEAGEVAIQLGDDCKLVTDNIPFSDHYTALAPALELYLKCIRDGQCPERWKIDRPPE